MMKCPYCQYTESKVIDSRPTDEGEKIRRRRECMRCGKRFTTYEIVETTPLMVVKKDHSIEPFNRDKLFNGLLRACEKRPVSLKSLEQIVDEIEQKLKNSLEGEVNSRRIGELAMEELRRLDQVAYVRFASVYREFQDINSFMDELRAILEEKEREELEKFVDVDNQLVGLRNQLGEVAVMGERFQPGSDAGDFFQRLVADVPDHRVPGFAPRIKKLPG